jgi:hypothetical protein
VHWSLLYIYINNEIRNTYSTQINLKFKQTQFNPLMRCRRRAIKSYRQITSLLVEMYMILFLALRFSVIPDVLVEPLLIVGKY